jgi:hypothetical protein
MTFDREHVVAELRRDASLLRNAAVAAVFICFVTLALGAAVIDLLALRN